MVQVDLITGFLGAGKTTFLRKYVHWLNARGQRVCILENDFGAVNVDVMLLQDLLGDNCDIETISGGCDCDTHQRRMRTKLISLAMQGFDRVLVEPSGIFDVDEFYDVLRDEPLDRWYTLGNVIAIVDALLETQLSPQGEYLLASEAASAGMVPDEPLPAGRPRPGGGNTGAFEPCAAGSLPLRPPLCCGHRCVVQALGRPDRRRYAAAGQLRPLSGQLRQAAF